MPKATSPYLNLPPRSIQEVRSQRLGGKVHVVEYAEAVEAMKAEGRRPSSASHWLSGAAMFGGIAGFWTCQWWAPVISKMLGV